MIMSMKCLKTEGTPKFHIGRENRYQSADLNRSMTPSTRFQAFACSGEWDWPWITAYFASRVSPSNLGNSVDQRSNLSTSTDNWSLSNVKTKLSAPPFL